MFNFARPGGNQQMRPLGQMWPQQPNGQFPLNPGAQQQQGQQQPGQLPAMQAPQMQPNTQFPMNPQAMGQPPQMQPPQMGQQGMLPQMQGWHQQMQDWHQQRPQFQGGPRPDDFRQQIQDWRGLQPGRPSMFQR